jgi:hypothetical protein
MGCVYPFEGCLRRRVGLAFLVRSAFAGRLGCGCVAISTDGREDVRETHAFPSTRPLAPLCVEQLAVVDSGELGVDGIEGGQVSEMVLLDFQSSILVSLPVGAKGTAGAKPFMC